MAYKEYKTVSFYGMEHLSHYSIFHIVSRKVSILPLSFSSGIQHYYPSRDSHFCDNAAAISVTLTATFAYLKL